MCEVEQQAYDLTKSTLIDAECHKFKPSLIVAALITAALEINLTIKYHKRLDEELASKPKPFQGKKIEKPVPGCPQPPVLEQISKCNQVWDRLLKHLFGKQCLTHVETLGHFLVLRQRKLFKTLCRKDTDFANVYKPRCKELYEHDFFAEEYLIVGSSKLSAEEARLSTREDAGAVAKS